MLWTRYWSARAATVGRKEAFVPPRPWSITTCSASGSPARATAMLPIAVRTRASTSRLGARRPPPPGRGAAPAGEQEPARVARPARRGEEADAEVEVVADLQPPPAERVHPAPEVPRHP